MTDLDEEKILSLPGKESDLFDKLVEKGILTE